MAEKEGPRAAAVAYQRATVVLPGLFGTWGPGSSLSLALKPNTEVMMPQGDKSSYSSKQKRQAKHIAEGYENRGTSHGEAERRAWATVNKESGGGKKSGSGRGKKTSHSSSRKGGHASHSGQSHASRSAAAKKGWETRRRKGKG